MKIVFTAFSLLLFSSFISLPKGIEKKVNKEISSFFEITEFSKISISVNKEINNKLQTKINEDNLFKIKSNQKIIGYLYVGKAPSKTDQFDFMVLFDTELRVAKSKILIYREDYGNEIGSRRWLKQFIGKSKSDDLKYESNIDAISGATISARSMTVAMNDLLKSIGVLQANNIL